MEWGKWVNKFLGVALIAVMAVVVSACGGGGTTSGSGSLSGAKAITAYGFTTPAVTGVIDEANKTISVTAPSGTSVTALVATFTLPANATAKVGTATQVSGITPNDFTNPAIYIVTAQDGTSVNYTVTVTVGTGGGGGAAAWTTRNPGTTKQLLSVTWGGNMFVAVGLTKTILTSPDGISWTQRSVGITTDNPWFYSVAWDGTQFVMVGDMALVNGIITNIFTSPDGANWTPRVSPNLNSLRHIIWSGTQFVAVGSYGAIVTSPDGVNWSSVGTSSNDMFDAVAWSGNMYVAVGFMGLISTSPDGVTWTKRISGTTTVFLPELSGVVWDGGKFIIAGEVLLTSPDGITWTQTAPGLTHWFQDIAWNGSTAAVVGLSGAIATSTDGISWTAENSGNVNNLYGVAWSPTLSKFVAVGSNGTVLTRP